MLGYCIDDKLTSESDIKLPRTTGAYVLLADNRFFNFITTRFYMQREVLLSMLKSLTMQ